MRTQERLLHLFTQRAVFAHNVHKLPHQLVTLILEQLVPALRSAQSCLGARELHAGGVDRDVRHRSSPLLLLRQVFVDILRLDALKLAARQDAQQLPAEVERLLDGAVLVRSLRNIALFKLIGELCIKKVGL